MKRIDWRAGRFQFVFPKSLFAMSYSTGCGPSYIYLSFMCAGLFIGFKKETWEDGTYGISFTSEGLHWNWGDRCSIWWYPWTNWACVRDQLMLEDGTMVDRPKYNEEKPEGCYSVVTPFSHTTRRGEVQLCDATVTVEEREWRPRWLRWTRLLRKVRRSIDVRFSKEMGDERGSWKGGTVGCGWELEKDEDPIDCLRRMEKEVIFR